MRRPDGKLVGFNTDYIGAITAIEDGLRGIYFNCLQIEGGQFFRSHGLLI